MVASLAVNPGQKAPGSQPASVVPAQPSGDRKLQLTQGQDVGHRQSPGLRFSPLPLTLHRKLENRSEVTGPIPAGGAGGRMKSAAITCLPLRLEAETSR